MKVLIVIAHHYNGNELWTTLGVLKRKSIRYFIISRKKEISDEITGFTVFAHDVIENFSLKNLKDFKAVIFIGGAVVDTEKYWYDEDVQTLVTEAMKLNLLLAGICGSVPIIRKAAKGKKVSLFPLIRTKEILRRAGAILTTQSLTIEPNLITAENQMVTQTWIECIVKTLYGEDVSLGWHDIGDITLRGIKPRKPDFDMQRMRNTWKKDKKPRI